MNQLVANAVVKIGAAIAGANEQELRLLCTEASRGLQKMMDIAGAIIHGSERRLDQSEIDGFMSD